ncbi:fatty acid desaturase [Xanthocytophaga agilis]|uniref:Fatty acid desaturase n=1 Tax=Xanthocytophaga agilis TaxID=3048010 RepID=A0AAE3R683_9BACT|nr:fatty acid desaturase [Xanthocytophaga agilis]MDJ1504509.1 fatty acid desaturase [Xanthocytophaga agilis]
MSSPKDFTYVTGTEPHRIRTRQILKSHPEVKKLISKNPVTMVWILVCVGIQLVMAYLLKDQPWYIILAAAWLIGAFPVHTLFVCIHEAAHNLIFRKPWANVAAGIIANFPSLIPTAISFKNYHLKHHAFQGVHELDADLPDYWEARLINNYFIGKMIWLLFFPVFQAIRTLRCIELAAVDKYVAMNIICQILFDGLIVYFWGWPALGYLGASFLFSVGLHPLGARWIQEHYLVLDKNQETYSYYGVLNTVNMNVGYHNEHHDMPSIPWNNLPKLKSIAPEFYDNLKYHTSFTKLFFTFLFSQEVSLFSRIVRKERGKVTLSDNSTPDLQVISAEEQLQKY